MIDTINSIVQNTPHGRIDLSVVRSHLDPKLIDVWDNKINDSNIFSIEITERTININRAFCINCCSREQAELFVIYLLAASSARGHSLSKDARIE